MDFENGQPPSNSSAVNAGFNPGFNDSASMQIRLDTESVKTKLYFYLNGYYETLEVDHGEVKKVLKKVGAPKVNDKGLQSIMLFVDQVMNAQTVQGNRDSEDFGMLMWRFRKNITRDVWVNMNDYGIHESQFDGIIDSICLLVEPFLSRTINNEERKSYGLSWVQHDSNTVTGNQKKSLIDYVPFIGGK